jgi:acrylyl-CoA reductase (NADPH)
MNGPSYPARFRALVADRDGDKVTLSERRLGDDDLPRGGVTIRVEWSSINYKDALVALAGGKVARDYPLVPGIDLAGEVLSAESDGLRGRKVLVHGYGLGVDQHGGFSEIARVPAEWVVPVPAGLSAREAMAIGTAGFTAALSVQRLESLGLNTGAGPVLVTGATGGVGSIAVTILAGRGYEVHASTGKDAAALLTQLGATKVLARTDTQGSGERSLDKAQWAAAIDPVGGTTLAYALRSLKYGGAAASSGLTGGANLATTVMPFILRGVSLLGVDSVQLDVQARRDLWARLAGDLRPKHMDLLTQEVSFDQVPGALAQIRAGQTIGRTVVRVTAGAAN